MDGKREAQFTRDLHSRRQAGGIVLVLRTPPPFGGGELRGRALLQHVQTTAEFEVIEVQGASGSKGRQGKFGLCKVAVFLSIVWRLLGRLIRRRPVLVFSPLGKSFPHFVRDSALFWMCWVFRVRFCGEVAGSGFYFLGRGPVRTWYGRLVLSRLACLRVLGDSIASEMRRFGIYNTIVTDNGVDLGDDYLRVTVGARRQPFALLFVGALSPAKGFSDLVAACRKLTLGGFAFRVHVIGEWISEAYRIEMATALDEQELKERFSFLGIMHGLDKAEVFRDSDALVLPSYNEGQPLVILEALASGLPVVSTKVGAIPDTIKEGRNGFMLDPGDVEGLAVALETLIRDPQRCAGMGRANRRLYLERFTERAFLETQVCWLRECAAGRLIPKGQFFRAGG